jgi:hypothetical protein
MKYEMSDQVIEDISRRFTYHPPKGDQVERYNDIRNAVGMLAFGLVQNVPPGRELNLALTKLEEACFWANAGIARGEA